MPKATQDFIGTSYMPIGGGYAYCALRHGLVIRNPQGVEVYFQPGDDEASIRDTIGALDEVSLDPDDGGRSILTDMALSVYFA
jgi:hypothetical protein